MDQFEDNTDFLYADLDIKGYASSPQVSPTLLLAITKRGEDPEKVALEMAEKGPAKVASERATQERNDEVIMLKNVADKFALEQNVPSVEEAVKRIQAVNADIVNPEPSFYDDAKILAESKLEQMMVTTGLPREKIIELAKTYSDSMATRTALEVAIGGLPKRGEITQVARDMLGVTSVADWMRLSPIVNEELEALGFKGDRAVTFATSANNFIDVLRNVDAKDRGKIINTLTTRLVDVVGEENTRRFLEGAQNYFALDPTTETLFNSLDATMIAGFIKGSLKAVTATTNALRVVRKTGNSELAALDAANKITNDISGIGLSTKEAINASTTAKILGDMSETGLSSDIQRILRDRTKATLDDIELTINTGGATHAEVASTKARLENIYSTVNNPSIISSSISADVSRAKLGIDVVYGDATGKAFSTEAEALAYYKDWKRGTLEVVPVGGKASDLKAIADDADARLAHALQGIDEAQFHPSRSTIGNIEELSRSPLFNFPKVAQLKGQKDAIVGRNDSIRNVWENIRTGATKTEQFIVDKIIETLPKETKIVIRAGKGRAYYSGATDTVVTYFGNKSTNVFSHELIHAVTSNKIKYGLATPSSDIGKIVTRMDTLRQEVRKTASKVQDKDLKHYLTYLTKNIDEFSTSGMWLIDNVPAVAAHLDKIAYKNTTLLSHLWETFKDLLGLGKKDTALSEWFGLNEELTRQGLKVTLPETIIYGSKTKKIVNRSRTYPANPLSREMDGLMTDLENAVSDKIMAAEELRIPSEGFYVRQVADMPVFAEDIGKITEEELNKMNLTLGKVNPRLSSVNSIYSPALAAMYKTTRLNKIYNDFITTSFNKLNKDQIDRVNNALIKTESFKRDMTTLELSMEGVKTNVELEAYYAFRTMRNIEWYAKNTTAANSLTAQGFNNVFVGLGEKGSLSGPAKKIPLSDFMGKRIFDVENNKFVTVTPENIKELDSRGLQGYRYQKAQELAEHKSAITSIAVHPNQMRSGDIVSAVGRVDGAYARIYTEEYFIQLKGSKLIDDTPTEVSTAFRTALNPKDAAKYVQGFNKLLSMRREAVALSAKDVSKYLGAFEKEAEKFADEINAGKYDGMTAKYNYTRIEDNFFRDVTGIGKEDKGEGKLFWSGRSEEGIKSISTGSTDAVTKGPLASLEAEINNTARFEATNEFRRNAIQRWFNTFEDVISDSDKLNTKSAEDVFFNVVNNVKGVAVNDTKAKQMLATKDFILSQLGAKTTDEKMLQHAISVLTNNITIPGFAHVGAMLRKANLVNWAKSVNSTLMLGLFSPAQLFVQASGMLLSATISPKHGLKAAFSVRPILTALTSDNPSVWKKIFKAGDVAKNSGMTENEFTRIAAAIRKTGLLDNIGASSVYNGADGATNIFAKNKNKFNQAQMMFFNKGEEINRVSSFDIARREFIEANPKEVWDSDEALKTILLRADDLTMNMSRVNEARISQGIYGIPLQFLQHNIRLGTNLASQVNLIAGKKSPTLSVKEALSLTLGSYLLYGVNNNASPDMLEDWLGSEFNGKLSETEKQYLTQGVLAGVISTIGETLTGERTNVALGSRLSSIQWYEDLWDSVTGMFQGKGLDVVKLAGPTGSTLVAALDLPVIFTDYLSKDELSLADFGRTVSTAGASMSSSWRNIDKAYWAYHANGMVINKRGDALANLTPPELFFQALGFQSTEAYESNTVFATKKDYTATMQSYADSILRFNVAAHKAYLANDIQSMNENYYAASSILAPLPLADQKFILNLTKQKTTYDTVGREAFNKWAAKNSSQANRLLVTNPLGEK